MKLWHKLAIGAVALIGLLWAGRRHLMRFVRLTSFGGPTDEYDNYMGQAFMTPRKAGETPAQYYARVPAWQRELLRPEMATATSWGTGQSITYRWDAEKQRVYDTKRVKLPLDVSGWMNDNAYFAAWHKTRFEPGWREAARSGRLWLVAMLPSGPVRARITDVGPARTDTLDVSKGFQAALKPHWPVEVFVRVED